MNVSWLAMIILCSWSLTLIGGLGSHVLTNFNGKRLEAYCRLRRRIGRYGEILDDHEQAALAGHYLLLFGLVLGSLSVGVWISASASVRMADGVASAESSWQTMLGWALGWGVLGLLAGVWLPRIVVHYSSSLFIFHSWPFWKTLTIITRPLSGFGDVFSWLGHRLSDEPDGEESEEEVLEDEIRTMVAAGQREGVFGDGVPEMIQGVMDLDEADVEEIMTPRSMVDALEITCAWQDVLTMVADCGRTRIPVYRETLDNVEGILFAKDLLAIMADEDFKPSADSLQTVLRKPWFIPSSKPVDELLRVFLHNRNHMAIVVDEYQQFVGVVTIEDALEEIVGEIADELDVDEDSEIIYHEDSHIVEAEGKVPIESLSKLLGVELPESDDYDTIGGLVIHRLSEIPAEGTSVDLEEVRITVLKATKRVIQRVRVELNKRYASSRSASSNG